MASPCSWWVGLMLLALHTPGCRRNEPADKPPGPAPQQKAEAPPRLDLTPGEPQGMTRFAADPVWTSAATLHEVELMRLADREGAAGLLEGVEAGRTVALTALAALPYANDGALALGRLCELLEQSREPPHPALLEAVHAIVARPPDQREPVAPRGYRVCLPVLSRLAQRTGLDPVRHDLASSTEQLLMEHRDAARH